jgi:hypothetical protein
VVDAAALQPIVASIASVAAIASTSLVLQLFLVRSSRRYAPLDDYFYWLVKALSFWKSWQVNRVLLFGLEDDEAELFASSSSSPDRQLELGQLRARG